MPEFVNENIAKAFRNILRGEHTFVTTERNTAVQEVRDICEDRIYSERREDGVPLPWVNISITGEDPQHAVQTGRTNRSTTFLEIIPYSHDPAERTRLKNAIVAALDFMSGVDVTVDDQTIPICSCYQESGSDSSDSVPDSSGDYSFEHALTFQVKWTATVSAGFD